MEYDTLFDEIITMIDHVRGLNTIKKIIKDCDWAWSEEQLNIIYFSAITTNWTELLDYLNNDYLGRSMYSNHEQVMFKYAIYMNDFDAVKAIIGEADDIDSFSNSEIYIDDEMINICKSHKIKTYLKISIMVKDSSDEDSSDED